MVPYVSQPLAALAIIMTVVASAFLPQALWTGRCAGRVIILILVLETQFLGQLVLIAEPGRNPMEWYRVPRTFVCSGLAIAYVLIVARDRRRLRRGWRALDALEAYRPR
ncbi:MAG TPA: hypothetical protein VF192_00975 [Longimicrobiales bacterium]